MRRTDREVKDIAAIREILGGCKTLRIALADENGLYIVPVSFGYELEGIKLTLYFHSAREGRKVSAMTPSCPVAFETDCDISVTEGEVPCRYGCLYKSIVGNGIASPVNDRGEKARALSVLMKHQTGREFSFSGEMTDAVAVFKIEALSYTAKARTE